ncbi:hypothetical protein Pint_27634 [Pistacia integerrima]|uniref:Uncharacterized protein n=1 Tax=Pistacia integerrima TaxID=434235 RepID=A0ACC0YNC1_9ROSI|nr:hypothetical protein Pint_27634 [Pistacia integerrima]
MISVPPPADDGSVKRGLDPAVIRTFPTFIYSAVKDLKLGKGALECAVCLSEFEDDEILHLIPKCDHVFHPDCIDLWLGSHVTCPVCRANLTIEQKEPARLTNANNDLNSNQNQNQNQNENNSVSEIVIDVNDELRRNDAVSLKFPRSHSTGHSLVLAGVNVERYTLRLPAEIRKQLINGKIKRTQSFSVVLGREGSSRVIGVEEIEVTEENVIWTGGFCRGLHRLFRRRGLVNFLKFEREGSSDSNSRNLLMAVTGPLNCLNMKVDQGEESSSRPSKPLI